MINLNNYIRTPHFSSLFETMEIKHEIVFVDYGLYQKAAVIVGESTLDSIIHRITGKEHASYFGSTYHYTWSELTKTYSRFYENNNTD